MVLSRTAMEIPQNPFSAVYWKDAPVPVPVSEDTVQREDIRGPCDVLYAKNKH